MGVYIYTIKDRESGEVLFAGREGAAAEYLGCARKYLYQLATGEIRSSKKTAFSHAEVSRQWREELVYCVDCGTEMPGAGPNRERCPVCAKKRNRELGRKHRAKKIAEVGEPQRLGRSAQDELQQECRGCIYFGGENYINSTCNYIFIEGHSRGDRYGEKCTKRKERKRK